MKKIAKKIVCALSILCVLLTVLIVPISAESTSFRDEFEFMFDKSFPNMENKIYLDTPDIGERNGLELAEYPMNVNNFSVANGVIMAVVRDQSEEGQFWEYVFEFNDLQIKSERNTRYLGQEYHYVIDDHETILVYERWLETWVYTVSCLIVPDEGEMPFGTYPSRQYDQYEYVFTLSREYYTSDDFELSEFGKDGYRNIETKLEQRFWRPDDDGGGFKLSSSSAVFMGIAWKGYSDGYNVGKADGEALHADDYQNGYDIGYFHGTNDIEQSIIDYYNDYWSTHYNSVAYGDAVQDSIESNDSNPVTAFFTSMWNGVLDAYDIVTQNVSVGGVSLAMVITTIVLAVVVIWVIKVLKP